jgi:hypothetical protein
MVLTNAERQARYRERLKAAASRASSMTPMLADLMLRTRLNIRNWKCHVALFGAGQMHLYKNHADCTEEHVATLRRMIEENGALLHQYDPDGLTSDGDVEFGEIPARLAPELWAGRPVTYVLNSDGLAEQIRPFDTGRQAEFDAAGSHGRLVGRVGEQRWSINTDREPS